MKIGDSPHFQKLHHQRGADGAIQRAARPEAGLGTGHLPCRALDYAFSGLYESRFTSLALNMGMHVLSAAASYQEAQEDAEKYGHGLFTYYLLKALEGEADTNRDRQVTVIEMGPYVREKVEKASSGSQKPFITNFGEDVVMGKVK